MTATDANNDLITADQRLRGLIEAMRLTYPELGLSFGYIGNCGQWGDDRCWCVFTKLSSKPAANACNVSWGYANTQDVAKLATPVRLGQLECWIKSTAARLAAGELYQVGADRWLAQERERASAAAPAPQP
jgi:hypothetical protein